MRVVDLSLPMSNFDLELRPPEISYYDHGEWARKLTETLGIPAGEFPGGHLQSMDYVRASTHTGTHVDAPYHFGPTCAGRPARTIDEVPLEWCYGAGLVLDVRHRRRGEVITPEDLTAACAASGREPAPGTIVLLMTGADACWGHPDYPRAHPGLGREAVVWLVDRGVRTIGIDAYGLDRPFEDMVAAHRAGEREALFPAHRAGREREFLALEKLTGLDRLPQPSGFLVACFPIRIAKASGAWSRVVAIFEDLPAVA